MVSLIFSSTFLVSISFIFTLIFIIYFLLLTSCFAWFSFSSSFKCKFRLFEIFLVSWSRPALLQTSLLELPLLISVNFGMLSFHFHWSQIRYFKIISLTHWLLSRMLFRLHVFVFSQFFSYSWFLVLYCCGWKRCFIWVQSS